MYIYIWPFPNNTYACSVPKKRPAQLCVTRLHKQLPLKKACRQSREKMSYISNNWGTAQTQPEDCTYTRLLLMENV